ncbi:MAG: membrane protein insertion efficiency factor YidD [Candidatus Omnitrophica bacterium]|nr:membrane protein insertion efficiency factor YidD [Candidatus Omnitrophota bacterium]
MPAKIFIKLVEFYQKAVRPFLPRSCRFTPSCSEYSKQALEKYGVIKGGALAGKRLLCCHPYSGRSGYDPLV